MCVTPHIFHKAIPKSGGSSTHHFKGLPHSLRFPRNVVSHPAWQSPRAPVLAHTTLGMQRRWGGSWRHPSAASRQTGLGSTQCPGWRAQCGSGKGRQARRAWGIILHAVERPEIHLRCRVLQLGRLGRSCSKNLKSNNSVLQLL